MDKSVLREKARAAAHQATPRCQGGHHIGSDHVRWHTRSCDALTEAFFAFGLDLFDAGERQDAPSLRALKVGDRVRDAADEELEVVAVCPENRDEFRYQCREPNGTEWGSFWFCREALVLVEDNT